MWVMGIGAELLSVELGVELDENVGHKTDAWLILPPACAYLWLHLFRYKV